MKNIFFAVAVFFSIGLAFSADISNDNYIFNRMLDKLTTGVPFASGTSPVTTSANVASGTIAAGCKSITFIASSDFSGTILTNFPLPASAGLHIYAQAGSTLGAIAFTRSAGTLYTVEVR